jgi:hypothetical protein
MSAQHTPAFCNAQLDMIESAYRKVPPGSRKAQDIIADSKFWRTELVRAVRAERSAARAAIAKATGSAL